MIVLPTNSQVVRASAQNLSASIPVAMMELSVPFLKMALALSLQANELDAPKLLDQQIFGRKTQVFAGSLGVNTLLVIRKNSILLVCINDFEVRKRLKRHTREF